MNSDFEKDIQKGFENFQEAEKDAQKVMSIINEQIRQKKMTKAQVGRLSGICNDTIYKILGTDGYDARLTDVISICNAIGIRLIGKEVQS